MESYLKTLAKEYAEKVGIDEIQEYTFVFPNRRAGLFFRKYLAETMPRAVLAPKIMTINDCFYALSDKQLADPIDLLFRVYEAYRGTETKTQTQTMTKTQTEMMTETKTQTETGAKAEKGMMRHGYAVMYGMVAEAYLSAKKMGLDKEVVVQLTHYMIENYGRPDGRCKDEERLIELMRHDKKNEAKGEINFTLLRAVGEPVVNQVVSEEEIREAIGYLFSV